MAKQLLWLTKRPVSINLQPLRCVYYVFHGRQESLARLAVPAVYIAIAKATRPLIMIILCEAPASSACMVAVFPAKFDSFPMIEFSNVAVFQT